MAHRAALTTVPAAGRDLEDYVAALFQSSGYFLERGIHERAFTDVLELDVVADHADRPPPSGTIVEAKGGQWGFPDLFKVTGWMAYLGICRGGFFVMNDNRPKGVARVRDKLAPLGLTLVDLADFRDPFGCFADAGFGEIRDGLLPEIWRYSFWAERVLLDRLRAVKRSTPDAIGPATALAYHDLVHHHVFFIKDVAERLGLLYEAYRSHPRLSAALAAELGGGPFLPAAPATKSIVLAEALHEGRHPALQASFYVEHRGRLSILKAAIDLVARGASAAPDGVPGTFHRGLATLLKRPSFRRYAQLWQVFLWGLGGFYLADRAEEELGWLSAQTGVPRGEVVHALHAFDDLFPARTPWIVPLAGTRILGVKMVPAPFRGIGALQRLRRYRLRTYRDLRYADRTGTLLARWHNALVAHLAT
jgi:hypothetical protein